MPATPKKNAPSSNFFGFGRTGRRFLLPISISPDGPGGQYGQPFGANKVLSSVIRRPLLSLVVLLFFVVAAVTTTVHLLSSSDEIVKLERKRVKVLGTLRSVNEEYHKVQAIEQEVLEKKALLLKDLDLVESDLVLAQDDNLDMSVRHRSGTTSKEPKILKCSGPGCKREVEEVSMHLQRPRIFVYDLPRRFNKELSRKYKRCIKDQYGTEVLFYEELVADKNLYRTTNPEIADFYFVPVYGECFLWQYEMLKKQGREKSFDLTNQLYLDALNIIKQYPYWNRSGGRDHIFVFPGARGPTIFKDWEQHIKSAIFLTPEGDRKANYFNTWKDIVIPGLESDQTFVSPESRRDLENEFATPKKFLAFFRGTINHRDGWAYSRGLRPRLQKLLANESDVIYDTKHSTCDRKCYRREMSQSKFCLNPLGWTPWTLRFYQALMVRCVPVMIADDIEFPYENEIDYSEFSLKIREKDVDNIVEFLRGISDEDLQRRLEAIDKVWLKFTYQKPPQPGDAFHTVMMELSRKKLAFKNSANQTWT